MRILELFSGIGGMHFALKDSGVSAEVVEALDINTTANQVYSHNFPNTKLSQHNVQVLTAAYINSKNIDLILMSPPCQPFTRQGKKKDVEDSRCAALLHFINLIPEFNEHLKYILLENVEGFESSSAHDSLIATLEQSNFFYKEFIITPKDMGFPNSRSRYYLLARKKPFPEDWKMDPLCNENMVQIKIADILDITDCSDEYENYLLSEEILKKRAWLLDIVTRDSKNSCCFTRGYTHYIEGTGSVYCPFTEEFIKETYATEKKILSTDDKQEEKLQLLKNLRLRFFTPREVANLLCFPRSFSFPSEISIKQKYRLLGNSINIRVVAFLIKQLVVN